jgi:NAD(P)-dependent dehydrogenase (short-subunit alcohol dehydrogenase family)
MAITPRTVLVTGASSGIGRATALALAAAGYEVLAAGRDEAALATLAQQARIHARLLDVDSDISVRDAMQRVDRLTSGRGLDVLINNAGFAVPGPIESVPIERLQAGFQTNVIGLVRMCQAVLPAMRLRGSGCIVNVSSIVGRISFPFEGAYTATKHAVEALSDALRFELQPFGVRVLVVQPGAIRSAFQERGDQELAASLPAESPYRIPLSGFLAQRAKAFKNAPDGGVVAQAIVRELARPSSRARIVVPRQANAMLALFTTGPDRWRDAIKRFAFAPARTESDHASGA